MSGKQVLLLSALGIGGLVYYDYHRDPVILDVIAIDITHDKTHYGQMRAQDLDHAVLFLEPESPGLPITWNDCPEYDSSGRLDGKRLLPGQCHDVQGYSAHDEHGTQWLISNRKGETDPFR